MEYLLDYTSTIFPFNLSIQGNDGRVICSSSEELSGYSHFPLYVSNTSFVVINRLHFEGCMRALQFNLVENIQITSSSFRYRACVTVCLMYILHVFVVARTDQNN